MMTSAAAAHMTVAMAVSALYQHDGAAVVGGNRACGNARHRECRRRRGRKRHGDAACLDKSFHWESPPPLGAAIGTSSRMDFCSMPVPGRSSNHGNRS
jgi:hypothetical protein